MRRYLVPLVALSLAASLPLEMARCVVMNGQGKQMHCGAAAARGPSHACCPQGAGREAAPDQTCCVHDALGSLPKAVGIIPPNALGAFVALAPLPTPAPAVERTARLGAPEPGRGAPTAVLHDPHAPRGPPARG